MVKCIFVVGIDCLSCLINFEDRIMVILFGDVVGVMIIEVSDEFGIFFIYINVLGFYGDLLYVGNLICGDE